MDFRTLEYFTAVAQELNFTKAADRLHMSQPPLSNQIRALEADLGVQLFIRGKRRLKLTEAGALLLQRSEQLLSLADQTRSELASLDGELSGILRLGIVEGRAPFLVARWIVSFLEEYPKVRFRIWNGSSDDVLQRMDHGLVDLSVIAAPYDNEHLDGFVVGKEPWIAILPKDHRLARGEGNALSLKKLAGEPLIVPQRLSRIESIRKWFQTAGIEPNILCEMSSYLDVVALVEQGVGIGIFPQTTYTPNPFIVCKTILHPAKYAEYDLVWYKGQRMGELAKQFRYFVQDYIHAALPHGVPLSPDFPELLLPEDASLL